MDKQISLQIVPITITHAAELAELAKNIYREYYLHLWHPGGADWYMHEHAYHLRIIEREISDSHKLHFIIYEQEKPVGFLKINLLATIEGIEQQGLEIERIYLHRSSTRKGTGRQVMLWCEVIARQHGKEIIFLKAMDTSSGPLAFYEKMGYTICGHMTLPFLQMKKKYRGMVVMKKSIQ